LQLKSTKEGSNVLAGWLGNALLLQELGYPLLNQASFDLVCCCGMDCKMTIHAVLLMLVTFQWYQIQ
jgi:hypothetical protein